MTRTSATRVPQFTVALAFVALLSQGGGHAQVPSNDQLCPPIPVKIQEVGDLPPLPPDALLPCNPALVCMRPPIPDVSGSAEPQSVLIKAKPYGSNLPSQYESINIWVEHYSSTLGWQTLYKHESNDAITRATGSNATEAQFVANGLIPGEPHRFSISFCRTGARKGCNCWSFPSFIDVANDGTADAQATTFPASPVPFPSGISVTQRIGEPFSSLPTKPRTASPTGDGWGSNTVWNTDDADILALDYTGDGTIDRLAHRLQQSSRASLVRAGANPISYTEAEFRALCTVSPTVEPKPNPLSETDCVPDGTSNETVNFRVDLETQYKLVRDICRPNDPNADIPYEYALQVAYEPGFPQPIGEPSLRLFRFGPASCPAQSSDYVNYLLGGDAAFTTIASLCPGKDVSALKTGEPLVARLIRIATDSGQPRLVVQLGWGGCTGSTCAIVCTVTKNEEGEDIVDGAISGTTHPLQLPGFHAFVSHHWDTDFIVVRGGSQ